MAFHWELDTKILLISYSHYINPKLTFKKTLNIIKSDWKNYILEGE